MKNNTGMSENPFDPSMDSDIDPWATGDTTKPISAPGGSSHMYVSSEWGETEHSSNILNRGESIFGSGSVLNSTAEPEESPLLQDKPHNNKGKDPKFAGDTNNEQNGTYGEQEQEEEEDFEEEEQSYNAIQSDEWTDDIISKFNPLSYKNTDDKVILQVKEIPEKEGLLFKHINYMVMHNIEFSSQYLKAAGARMHAKKSNDQRNANTDSNINSTKDANTSTGTKTRGKGSNETKVVRRYSDFAWLADALMRKYPYRMIPPLPPKKFASK